VAFLFGGACVMSDLGLNSYLLVICVLRML